MAEQKVKMSFTERARLGGLAGKRPNDHDPLILRTMPGSISEQAAALGVATSTIVKYRKICRDQGVTYK